ncbi:pyridoxamine 5'-phosphate oxidase family protein [Amycolatopsis albispora]|uniref:Pyridoxamine 5'-phosphate oxidase n=1 Tax=Amycolatopsis albispora TaxID=1804986 RepID=A0A344LAS8_9PSEU|nr:pyridoxamine 5'-phosphate oxidase family protein [Amycolatopsis albispora]AXB45152.1 pyridoxamine 5'-phosphate oxidase [Amycolatopsis albispora]
MKVESFAEIQPAFFEYVADIGYATMTTVDSRNRPRARVMLAVWEVVEGKPRGWLAAYRTPVKVAHLAKNPHTTFSYWSPRQNAVAIDCVARWDDDPAVRRQVWELYRKGSPPGVGYDPIRFWRGGPDDPEYHVLRLDPWRVQVVRGRDLTSRIWVGDTL